MVYIAFDELLGWKFAKIKTKGDESHRFVCSGELSGYLWCVVTVL